MALRKTITLPNGVVVNYHRIGYVRYEHTAVIVTVNSYVDEMHRRDEEVDNTIIAQTFGLVVDDGELINYSALYNKLKQLEVFEGAEDC